MSTQPAKQAMMQCKWTRLLPQPAQTCAQSQAVGCAPATVPQGPYAHIAAPAGASAPFLPTLQAPVGITQSEESVGLPNPFNSLMKGLANAQLDIAEQWPELNLNCGPDCFDSQPLVDITQSVIVLPTPH
jgi:hypothetical protein